jgi:glucokinase
VTALAIGIDVGGTRTKCGLVDGAGRVLAQTVAPTVLDDAEAFSAGLVRSCAELCSRAGAAAVVGAGIAVPGFVDPDRDRIAMVWERLAFLERPGFRADLEGRLGLRCVVDNDARAAAIGEARHGAGVGASRLLVLTIGTGIGFGFTVDGRFTERAPLSHMAGHIRIGADGGECICGLDGCLESVVSARGLVRSYLALKPEAWSCDEPLDGERIAAAAAAGDAAAREALMTMARHLATGLDSYVSLLAPDRIVIGGGLSRALAGHVDWLRAAVRAEPFPGHRVEIAVSVLQESAGIIGAASIALAAPEIAAQRG